jgi:hypothetical protein
MSLISILFRYWESLCNSDKHMHTHTHTHTHTQRQRDRERETERNPLRLKSTYSHKNMWCWYVSLHHVLYKLSFMLLEWTCKRKITDKCQKAWMVIQAHGASVMNTYHVLQNMEAHITKAQTEREFKRKLKGHTHYSLQWQHMHKNIYTLNTVIIE